MEDRSLSHALKVRLIRDTIGMGIMDAKKAMELSEGDEFGGDVMLAIAYVEAAKCPIMVSPDRHRWNMDKAAKDAEDFRTRYPELDAVFGRPGSAPRP